MNLSLRLLARSATFPWVALCMVLAPVACSGNSSSHRADVDTAAIRTADLAYVTAWLTNDADGVMATLTDDAVIMPFGIPAIEGTEAIRTFWWPPDSPPATITEFTAVQHDAGGGGHIGYVRGSFSLSFEYDGKTLSNHGDYLSILRHLPDGSWRISHRAWNDLQR